MLHDFLYSNALIYWLVKICVLLLAVLLYLVVTSTPVV